MLKEAWCAHFLSHRQVATVKTSFDDKTKEFNVAFHVLSLLMFALAYVERSFQTQLSASYGGEFFVKILPAEGLLSAERLAPAGSPWRAIAANSWRRRTR